MGVPSHPGAAVSAGERSRRLRRPQRAGWRGWRRPAIELAGLVIGVVLFSWLHNLAGTDVARATANAHALQSVERALGLDVEVAANHWLAGSPVLSVVAVWCYRLYYVPMAGLALRPKHPRAALLVWLFPWSWPGS